MFPAPLLIWGEQGLGDQIIYASMMPDVQKRADKIVLEVEPRLMPFLSALFRGRKFDLYFLN